MRDTKLSEVRSRARHFFDLVEAGEAVRVLRNGHPVAEIRPIGSTPLSWKHPPARPLAIGGKEVGRVIVEARHRRPHKCALH